MPQDILYVVIGILVFIKAYYIGKELLAYIILRYYTPATVTVHGRQLNSSHSGKIEGLDSVAIAAIPTRLYSAVTLEERLSKIRRQSSTCLAHEHSLQPEDRVGKCENHITPLQSSSDVRASHEIPVLGENVRVYVQEVDVMQDPKTPKSGLHAATSGKENNVDACDVIIMVEREGDWDDSGSYIPPQIQAEASFGEEQRLTGGGSPSRECAVCLGNFAEGEPIKFLPGCGHFFHSECIDKWLRASATCPLCRMDLRGDPL